MKTAVDGAGRLVIPKALRDRLGIVAGTEVEISEEGAGLRIDVFTSDHVIEVEGRLLIGPSPAIDDEFVREMRLADQR